MKKLISIATAGVLMLLLSSCGYQGGYRYSCQDPANWDAAECNPPICETTGTCSRDLVGEDVWTEYQNGKNNG